MKKKDANTTYFGKLRRLPGMSQAFMMVFTYTRWFSSVNKVEQDSDKKSKEIEYKAVRKIAELWELSEAAEELLIKKWVERKPRKAKVIDLRKKTRGGIEGLFRGIERVDKSYEIGVEILLGEEEGIKEIQKACAKLNDVNVTIQPLKTFKDKHIYLDVSEIDYKTYTKAYRAVLMCRDKLGISAKRDMKRGAPESIDGTRALLVAYGEGRGISRKKLAEIMDFKIYREDNPSGSFPLLHKYLKAGREIADKLDKLEEYLQSITGLRYEDV